MQSNCNLNVIKYCLGAIVITIIIDSTLGLINCRKKVTSRYKSIIVFIKKQFPPFLLAFFYLLPDGKINRFY